MKQGAIALMIAAAALLLTGCSETGFTDMVSGGKPSAQGNMAVQTNQNLAMPPDLRLAQPGAATSEAQVATAQAPADDSVLEEGPNEPVAAPAEVASTSVAPAKPAGDVYERNGISKIGPDGKPKSEGQLQAELKEVYLAKKRQSDPNYGTIWNLGSIFKDG